MKYTESIVIAAVIITFFAVLAGPVSGAAADEYPEDCDEAPVISEGTYSGTINSPGDVDAFEFDLSKGDYYSFKFDVDGDEENFWLWFESGTTSPEESVQDVRNADYTVESYPGVGKFINNVDGGVPFYFEFWSEESSTTRHCISVEERPDGGEPPYDWSMEVVKNDDFSTPTATRTPTPTVTPTPTLTPTPTATATPAQGDGSADSTPSPTDVGGSGDDVRDTDGDGVIDSEDYAPRDPDVQEQSDLQDASGGSGPGFEAGITVVALLVATVLLHRRS